MKGRRPDITNKAPRRPSQVKALIPGKKADAAPAVETTAPAPAAPKCALPIPPFLTAKQKEYFVWIVECSPPGILTLSDVPTLCPLAIAYEQLFEANEEIAISGFQSKTRDGTMKNSAAVVRRKAAVEMIARLTSQLCIDPTGRFRLSLSDSDVKNERQAAREANGFAPVDDENDMVTLDD